MKKWSNIEKLIGAEFRMKNILFIALLLSATNCFGEDFFRVVGIHDGDSITVLSVETKKQIKIRLEGIDAPELKQAFGSRAKEHLSSLIMGKDVTLIVKGEDLYKRTLSKILLGAQDVNLTMISDGFACQAKPSLIMVKLTS